MLFSKFRSLFSSLKDPAHYSPEYPFVLVCNTGYELWALLDPAADRDCLQFFEDPRNTMVSLITANDVRTLPMHVDIDALEDSLAHHAVNINPSARQLLFTAFFESPGSADVKPPPAT